MAAILPFGFLGYRIFHAEDINGRRYTQFCHAY